MTKELQKKREAAPVADRAGKGSWKGARRAWCGLEGRMGWKNRDRSWGWEESEGMSQEEVSGQMYLQMSASPQLQDVNLIVLHVH